MKILLLELSGTDSCERMPSKYSGAGPTFRRLAENIPNVYLAAEESCFNGDINDKCIPLLKDDVEYIRNNQPLNPYLFGDNFDIVVYASPSITLSTNKPQLCWAVGQSEEIHPEIKNLLLHDISGQYPILGNDKTKIHEFVLGVDLPEFKEYEKSDFIIQITNHYPQINSATLAHLALKHEIKTIFAGPITNYPLLNLIDYETTFYLGQIKEEEKIKLLKKAKLAASLYSFPINGPPLFTKQCLSYGCGFLTTHIPSMDKIIKDGENGFFIVNEASFVNAWNNRDQIDQKVCWNTAQAWSIDKMVDSFNRVIYEIYTTR